jgi:hypothetical protein
VAGKKRHTLHDEIKRGGYGQKGIFGETETELQGKRKCGSDKMLKKGKLGSKSVKK